MNSDLDFQDTRVPSFIPFDSDSTTKPKKIRKRKRKSQLDSQPVTKKTRKRLPKNGTLDSFITKEVKPVKSKEIQIWVGAVVESQYGAYGVYFGENDERNFAKSFIIEQGLQNSDYGYVVGTLDAINSLKPGEEPVILNITYRGLPQAISNPNKKYHYKELTDQIRDKITKNKRNITVRHISPRSSVDEHKLALELASDVLKKLNVTVEDEEPSTDDIIMEETLVEDIVTEDIVEDIVIEENTVVDIAVEDASEENVASEEISVEEVTVEEVTVEEAIVEEATVEETTVEETTVEETTVEETTVEEVTVKEVTVEEATVEEVTVEKVTVEEVTTEVAAVNNVDLNEISIEKDITVNDPVVHSDITETHVAKDTADVSVTTVTTVVEEVNEIVTTETSDKVRELVKEEVITGTEESMIEDLNVSKIETASDNSITMKESVDINQKEEVKETSSWASVFGIRGLLDVLYSPFKSRKS